MSLDYPYYELMKRECPQAARYWRAGDRLYYLGLLAGVVSVMALPVFRTITVYLVIATAVSAVVLALAVFLKRKSYAIARQSGCKFPSR